MILTTIAFWKRILQTQDKAEKIKLLSPYRKEILIISHTTLTRIFAWLENQERTAEAMWFADMLANTRTIRLHITNPEELLEILKKKSTTSNSFENLEQEYLANGLQVAIIK